MDKNEVTKLFLVGNTFRQATMHAQMFFSDARLHELGLWLNQEAILKKR